MYDVCMFMCNVCVLVYVVCMMCVYVCGVCGMCVCDVCMCLCVCVFHIGRFPQMRFLVVSSYFKGSYYIKEPNLLVSV